MRIRMEKKKQTAALVKMTRDNEEKNKEIKRARDSEKKRLEASIPDGFRRVRGVWWSLWRRWLKVLGQTEQDTSQLVDTDPWNTGWHTTQPGQMDPTNPEWLRNYHKPQRQTFSISGFPLDWHCPTESGRDKRTAQITACLQLLGVSWVSMPQNHNRTEKGGWTLKKTRRKKKQIQKICINTTYNWDVTLLSAPTWPYLRGRG